MFSSRANESEDHSRIRMPQFSYLAYMIYTKAVQKIENDCRGEFHCGGMEGIPRLESRQVFG